MSKMYKVMVLGGGNDQETLIKEIKKKINKPEIILIDYLSNPICAPFVSKHIQISTLDKYEVEKVARSEKIDLIITACTDQALVTMAYVSEKLGTPCYLTHLQALETTNKVLMKSKMIDNGIPTSNFQCIKSEEDVIQNNIVFPVVVKPADSNSSKGITMVRTKNNLQAVITKAFTFSESHQVIVEEFKDGIEVSIDAVVTSGIVSIILITRTFKMKSNCDTFTIIKSQYPIENETEVRKQALEILQKIASVFGIANSPILLQLIVSNNEVSVIEFACRMGGGSKIHLLEQITGTNMMSYLIDLTFGKTQCAIGNFFSGFVEINYIYVKPGIFSEAQGFYDAKNAGLIDDYFIYRAPGTVFTKSENSADRIAGYIISDYSLNSLYRKIEKVDNNLRILNYIGEDIMMHGIHDLWIAR